MLGDFELKIGFVPLTRAHASVLRFRTKSFSSFTAKCKYHRYFLVAVHDVHASCVMCLTTHKWLFLPVAVMWSPSGAAIRSVEQARELGVLVWMVLPSLRHWCQWLLFAHHSWSGYQKRLFIKIQACIMIRWDLNSCKKIQKSYGKRLINFLALTSFKKHRPTWMAHHHDLI